MDALQPTVSPPQPADVCSPASQDVATASEQEGWGLAACCLAAAAVLGLTLQFTNGSYGLEAVQGLTLAITLGLVGLFGPRFRRPLAWGESLLALMLGIALLLQLRALLSEHPGVHLRLKGGPWPYAEFYTRLAAAALVSGALLAGPARLRRVGIPVLLGLHLVMGAWLIRRSPAPYIDVFVFQTQAVDALLRGENPYAMTFPNIYGHALYYGEGLVAGGRLQFGFPYPPLSFYFSLLGKVLGGDPRYAQLLAMTLSAGLMAWTRGGRLGAGVAALFLLTPRGFFVLEQSWTEPFLVLLLAATVFCACRFPRVLPYVFGLLLAVKQYTVFLVPLAVLLLPHPRRQAWGFLWRAAVTALVVSLPLILPGVGVFLHSVVTLQLHQPFRTDALSYLAWWVNTGHLPPPMWIPFAAVFAMLGLCLWRAPRSPAGFAAATALTYVTFFALNKQAFCNYYYFVVGALCVVVAAVRLPVAAPATSETLTRS